MDATSLQKANLDAAHWERNLIVCVFGSFTTIVAMTLLLPFLPIYVEQLGVTDHAAIVQWSGIAYGAAFFSAALTAPLWGRLADRYGRKLMLIRASLGMAIAMSLIGMAHNVWELVGLRLLADLVDQWVLDGRKLTSEGLGALQQCQPLRGGQRIEGQIQGALEVSLERVEPPDDLFTATRTHVRRLFRLRDDDHSTNSQLWIKVRLWICQPLVIMNR